MANIQAPDFQAYVTELITETFDSVKDEVRGSKFGRKHNEIEYRRSNQPAKLEESQDD